MMIIEPCRCGNGAEIVNMVSDGERSRRIRDSHLSELSSGNNSVPIVCKKTNTLY